jgi:UDP-2-acetamido-2-deoxy-ribo-hexuluronate aminotransferase
MGRKALRAHPHRRRWPHGYPAVCCGSGKLERFEWEVEQRLKIGARYNELFAGKVPTVAQRPDRTSVFAQYTVFVENREQVQEKLKAAGVPTAVHYPVPLHLQPAYKDHCRVHGGVGLAEEMSARVMSLPMPHCPCQS